MDKAAVKEVFERVWCKEGDVLQEAKNFLEEIKEGLSESRVESKLDFSKPGLLTMIFRHKEVEYPIWALFTIDLRLRPVKYLWLEGCGILDVKTDAMHAITPGNSGNLRDILIGAVAAWSRRVEFSVDC